MARFTPLLLILLALMPLYFALDCRKFSFAPACRGIMLKRSGGHAVAEQAPMMMDSPRVRELQLVDFLLRAIEDDASIANSDCVSMSWLRDRLNGVKNEAVSN